MGQAKNISNLVLFKPFFKKWLFALNQDWANQFEGFIFVHLALFQEDTEILKKGRSLSRSQGDLLEELNGLGGSQNSLGGIGSNTGSLSVISFTDQLIKTLEEEVFGTRESAARSEANGQIGIVQGTDDVRNDVLLIDTD